MYENLQLKRPITKITINKLIYKINKEEKTAGIIGNYYSKGAIAFIPRSIIYESQEYLVTTICKNAFRGSEISSIQFPSDSELRKIESAVFYDSQIDTIKFPRSLEDLDEEWCDGTYMTRIFVDPRNPFYKNYDDKFIIGKSSKEKENFDVLLFSIRNIQIAEIPDFIEIIAPNAFYECRKLETVNFSENSKLKIIDKHAFYNCIFFCITIPQHVKHIGENAFHYCWRLNAIEIPENSELQTISNRAFYGTKIVHLMIPSNFQKFEDGWCNNTTFLTDICISQYNKNYIFYDNKYIVGKSSPDNENFDVLVFAVRNIGNEIIPSFIKTIGPFAFDGCINFRALQVHPDSNLQKIENFAFEASNIENITIPSNFVEFKKKWCYRVDVLNHVNIMPKNKNFSFFDGNFIIGKSSPENIEFDVLVFAIRSIKKAIIPSFIKTIASNAFSMCHCLKEVIFQNDSQLQFIDECAFHIAKVEQIVLPKKLKIINESAFCLCTRLWRVKFPDDCEIKYINTNAFAHTVIKYIEIPKSITKLPDGVFHSSSLRCISIPPNIIEIDKTAFDFDQAFQIIEFDENSKLKYIATKMFKKCRQTLIMIPQKLKDQIEFVF